MLSAGRCSTCGGCSDFVHDVHDAFDIPGQADRDRDQVVLGGQFELAGQGHHAVANGHLDADRTTGDQGPCACIGASSPWATADHRRVLNGPV